MDIPWGIVIAVGLLTFVLCGAWLSARRGELADVEIAGDKVVITMRGLNKIWALKGRLDIPLSNITQATYVPFAKVLARGWRWPGTAIPGVIIAGSYVGRGHRAFYAIHRGENGLVIEIEDWKYGQVIVDTPAPDEVAERIDEARAALRPA